MKNWLRKDPIKKLEKEHARHLELARDLQRNGDIVGCSDATAEAEVVLSKIKAIEAERGIDNP